MKKIVLLFTVTLIIGFIGCDKEKKIDRELIINGQEVGDTIIMSDTGGVFETDTFMFFLPKVGDVIKDNGIEYTVLVDYTLKVTKVETSAIGTDGVLNIPEITSKGLAIVKDKVVIFDKKLPVTEMDNSVMKDRLDVKEVRMPSVIKVGKFGFENCSNLINVQMPMVKIVEQHSFCSCKALVEVEMSAVETVENEAFYGCIALANVKMPMVNIVGNNAFYECESLIKVEMQVVKRVENEAFAWCSLLTSVEMPTAEMVGDKAFFKCEKLIINNQIISTDTRGVMYDIVDNENAKVLNYTKNIVGSFIIPATININGKDYNVLEVGNGAFYGCKGLTGVVMPQVKMLGKEAFYLCKALESVIMSNSGCCYQNDSFRGCKWQPGLDNSVISSCW